MSTIGAPRRARPPVLGGAATTGGGVSAVPPLLPTRHIDQGPGVFLRVSVGVWTVWDEEDLVGCTPTRAPLARTPKYSSDTL
jgi:hypothetical protein